MLCVPQPVRGNACSRSSARMTKARGPGGLAAPGPLALMLGLAEEVHTAIAEAVKGLRGCGYSWAEIGSRLGITRQAAQQRWGGH